jgi:hypothetical protein
MPGDFLLPSGCEFGNRRYGLLGYMYERRSWEDPIGKKMNVHIMHFPKILSNLKVVAWNLDLRTASATRIWKSSVGKLPERGLHPCYSIAVETAEINSRW